MVERCFIDDLNIYRPSTTTADLSVKLGCNLFQASLLEMRGITLDSAVSETDSWLNPDMEKILDALDLGIASPEAVALMRNLSSNSEVLVYGDYDVDGISSTAIATEIAMAKGASVRYYIPHRFSKGYGLHTDIAQIIVKRKFDLVIVVDCGSKDVEAVKIIQESGIPVIIFDHHLVEGTPALQDTMINPQISGDSLARKLCAAGVIWSWAWQNEILPAKKLNKMLDLVALATIADCVSMASPLNRSLVQKGVQILRTAPRQGLQMLMEKLDIVPSSLIVEDLSMQVIPCLNAAGRLDVADTAVKILFSGKNLESFVDKIISLNKKRRALSSKVLAQVDASEEPDYRHVLTNDEWVVGILSSVASRVCNSKNAPVALVAPVGENMRGTLRMPKGGDAVAILKELSPLLNTWGGHKLAAGFSVSDSNWSELRDKMEYMLSKAETNGEKEEILYWDPSELSLDIWEKGEEIGPFGMDNPAPILYSPYRGVAEISPLGKAGRHIKINIGESTLIGFDAVNMFNDTNDFEGWAYKPRINTWRNMTNLQLILDKIVVS